MSLAAERGACRLRIAADTAETPTRRKCCINEERSKLGYHRRPQALPHFITLPLKAVSIHSFAYWACAHCVQGPIGPSLVPSLSGIASPL